MTTVACGRVHSFIVIKGTVGGVFFAPSILLPDRRPGSRTPRTATGHTTVNRAAPPSRGTRARFRWRQVPRRQHRVRRRATPRPRARRWPRACSVLRGRLSARCSPSPAHERCAPLPSRHFGKSRLRVRRRQGFDHAHQRPPAAAEPRKSRGVISTGAAEAIETVPAASRDRRELMR